MKEKVYVFQVCECDAVAAESLEDALVYYKKLTGLEANELYDYENIQTIPFDTKVRESEDSEEFITVGEIVETYWSGDPFIALSTGGY